MTAHKQSAFTLIEMAVVLVIMGFIIMTVFPALTALRTSSARNLTQSNLQTLMRATAAYVQANGCLPCPSDASIAANGFGRVRGDSSASPLACGSCLATSARSTLPEGIPPFMSLGVPESTARDGWGHWITMRVDPELATNFGILPPTAPCQCSDFSVTQLPTGCSITSAGTSTTASCSMLGASQKGLCRAGLKAIGNPINVITPGGSSQAAAVIFVSHGVNGFGSFYADVLGNFNNGGAIAFPTSAPGCSIANGVGYAQCNAANTGTQFVNATTVIGGTDPYDDVLAFADRDSLVSMLGNGSCQTAW